MRLHKGVFSSGLMTVCAGVAACLTAGAAQAQISLSVTASCPGGGPITISWEGATPRGHVSILFGRNAGTTVIPQGNTCAGTTLAIRGRVREIMEGMTGATGAATIMGEARPGACGGNMQLIDMSSCGSSDIATVQ